jgi:hypothetical protein
MCLPDLKGAGEKKGSRHTMADGEQQKENVKAMKPRGERGNETRLMKDVPIDSNWHARGAGRGPMHSSLQPISTSPRIASTIPVSEILLP